MIHSNLQIQMPRYDRVLGLPSRAIPLTNSERSNAACQLRWWFSDVERLKPLEVAKPLRYGKAWALWMAALRSWWMDTDTVFPASGLERCPWCGGSPSELGCGRCENTGLGPVRKAEIDWGTAAELNQITGELAEELSTKLRRAVQGYLMAKGFAPPNKLKVVGVEVQLATPILSRTGALYRPDTWVVRQPDGSVRLAGTGDARSDRAMRVRWPWYYVGTLDVVFQNRETGVLWVGEDKSSGDPAGYLRGLLVDPQLAGYSWLLDQHKAHWDAPRVAGYIYDVSSSQMQRDPKPLKAQKVKKVGPDGKPFKVKGRWVYMLDVNGDPIARSPRLERNHSTTPSWRYHAAMMSNGFVYTREATAYVEWLREFVDPKLYKTEWGKVGADEIQRFCREISVVAKRHSAARRAAATGRFRTAEHASAVFPRTAVCRLPGGRCAYRGPCIVDDLATRDRTYQLADHVRWISATTEPESDRPERSDDDDDDGARLDLGW